ncbi:unnamed protein product [Eretmochelys imbricata]
MIWTTESSEKPTHSSPTATNTLVFTLLTDRYRHGVPSPCHSGCYVTLTTALHLHRGGSPKGPASTGKMETVKDLGKALGMYVIVVNCSNGLDYKSRGHVFLGLAQTGACGCFDEFNRFNIVSRRPRMFGLHWTHRAARQPQSMFRPISMVVPDFTLIAEIILFRKGFSNCKLLANIYTLYSLAMQQLTKQDRFDFGLRALTSLLRYAGKKLRVHLNITNKEMKDSD